MQSMNRWKDSDWAEEEKYFGRMEIIRQLMKDRFVNLDPDYADDVLEKSIRNCMMMQRRESKCSGRISCV